MGGGGGSECGGVGGGVGSGVGSGSESDTTKNAEYFGDVDDNIIASEQSDSDSSKLSSTRKIIYKKISFNELQSKITRHFEHDSVHRYSSAMDILASYLKGQKIIYMEAKHYSVNYLNILMFPSIFFAVLASIGQEQLSLFTTHASTILACLNAMIAFLLAIINYSKLEAVSEAHKTSAHQYDKLQSYLEFQSGQILLFSDPLLSKNSVEKQFDIFSKLQELNVNDNQYFSSDHLNLQNSKDLYEKKKQLIDDRDIEKKKLIDDLKIIIAKLEEKVLDIKNINQFIIPRDIRYRFPIIYHTNVFSVIKKIDDYKIQTINDLKHIKNEIRYINSLQKKFDYNLKPKYENKLKILFRRKKKLTNQILSLNTAYSMIDKIFLREITNAEIKKKNPFKFLFNDFFTWCCPNSCNRSFLPNNYIPFEEINCELLEKIMDIQFYKNDKAWFNKSFMNNFNFNIR